MVVQRDPWFYVSPSVAQPANPNFSKLLPLEPFDWVANSDVQSPGMRVPREPTLLELEHNPDLPCMEGFLKVAVTKLDEEHIYRVSFGRALSPKTNGRWRHLRCNATKQHSLEQVHHRIVEIFEPRSCPFARELISGLRYDLQSFQDCLLVVANQLYMLLPE